MNKLDRIWFLLSLATDKGAAEEEARTAAMQAARLIVENKIDLVGPYEQPAPPPQPPPPAPPKAKPAARAPAEHPDGRVISSKYPSWCRICRAAVNVGDCVYWVPSHGVAHYECWQRDG